MKTINNENETHTKTLFTRINRIESMVRFGVKKRNFEKFLNQDLLLFKMTNDQQQQQQQQKQTNKS